MNNEPVAWMQTWENQDGELKHTVNIQQIGKNDIPLYTHPAKTEDEGKVCARCGAIAYDPVITYPAKPTKVKFASNSCESGWIYLDYEEPAKTLTDEEIDKVMKQTKNWYEFARAILRKAQEK